MAVKVEATTYIAALAQRYATRHSSRVPNPERLYPQS
jgi:hypothetical protein